MKSMGMIRRIDELGRIVIPKETRNMLNINPGEELEILLENENIILKKYYRIDSKNNAINSLIELFLKYINGNIILTDREKINISREKIENKKLNKSFLNILESRKKITNLDKKELIINDKLKITDKFILYPMITNIDLIGSLILYSENITSGDIVLFSILFSLIKQELEN